MIHIVPFHPDHLLQLETPWNDSEMIIELLETKRYGIYLHQSGPSFSGMDDEGTWLGSFGAAVLWRGVAELWLILDKRFHKHFLSFHKLFLSRLNTFPEMYGLHRMQTAVDTKDHRARRWIESMGFENEGLMRGYGSEGQDYYRYGKVVI